MSQSRNSNHHTSVYQKFTLPWHPFLFSLLPLVIILAQNGGEIGPGQSFRSGLLSLILVSLLLLFFFLFQLDWQQAAVSTTLAITFFHTSGRLISGNVLEPLRSIIQTISSEIVLVGLLGLFLISLLAIARIKRFMQQATIVLNVIGISLFLTFLGTALRTEWKIYQPRSINSPTFSPEITTSQPLPNIYYIVLDGYGRADVLSDLYGAEEQPLLDYLSNNHFNIIKDARSNYMQTSLSLASSLNLNYLDTELSSDQLASNDRLLLLNLIRHNRLQFLLENYRYQSITIASGYRPSELLTSSSHYSPPGFETNLFERLIIENSALIGLKFFPTMPASILYPGYPLHRQRVDYSLNQLVELSMQATGPRFVFAHLLVPHPPFVFDSSGQPRQPSYPYVLLDGDAFPGERSLYRRQYEAQRAYLDRRLQQTLETILEDAAEQDIIIIQADHGPGSELDWSSASETNLRERFGILLAYRIPDNVAQPSQPPRSPVNVFRSILGVVLEVELPQLPDGSYFSTWDRPLNFIPVDPQQLTVID